MHIQKIFKIDFKMITFQNNQDQNVDKQKSPLISLKQTSFDNNL